MLRENVIFSKFHSLECVNPVDMEALKSVSQAVLRAIIRESTMMYVVICGCT
jgi:hypothetical protein